MDFERGGHEWYCVTKAAPFSKLFATQFNFSLIRTGADRSQKRRSVRRGAGYRYTEMARACKSIADCEVEGRK